MATSTTFQAGVRRFVDRWNQHGARFLTRRLEGAVDRDFLLECPGEPSLLLRLDRSGATLSDRAGHAAPHAVIHMPAKDWAEVLSGRWSVMSVVLGGRAPFPKHQRRFIMQVSMLMQTLLLLEAK